MNCFSETQRFTQWWLWTIVISISALCVTSFMFGWPSRAAIMPHGFHTYPFIMAPFFLFFLLSTNLKTEIDETGISYRFFPYHLSPVKISWDEVGRVYTRSYTSAEFGGRGKRPSWTNSGFGINYNHSVGKACTLSGNTGLQIVFKNGEKLLLGTQRPDEIEETLRLLQSIGKIPKSVDPQNSASFI